jgi:hypothetical protein
VGKLPGLSALLEEVLLTLIRKAINRSNMSSLSVEQSKLTQQSTMKLGFEATCASVSNINSRVSLGTGGNRLRGLGVDEAEGSAFGILPLSLSKVGVPGREMC